MNTKQILLLVLALASATPLASAQTNTFPTSGFAGSGTSSPNQQLEVYNGNFGVSRRDGYNSSIILDSDAGNTGDILFKDGGVLTTLLRLNSDSNGGTFDLQDRVGGAQSRLYIDGSGNVGIGTTAPNENLSIYGNSGSYDPQTIGIGPHFSRRWIIKADGFDSSPQYGTYPLIFEHDAEGLSGDFAVKQSGGSFVVKQGGNVGIGTTSPGNKLEVNGTIRSKEVVVESSGWPDYVFEDGYALPSLSEVESHIEEKGHLPGVEPASSVNESGQSLGAMQRQMMQKIEELTLYVIELQRQNDLHQESIQELEVKLAHHGE